MHDSLMKLMIRNKNIYVTRTSHTSTITKRQPRARYNPDINSPYEAEMMYVKCPKHVRTSQRLLGTILFFSPPIPKHLSMAHHPWRHSPLSPPPSSHDLFPNRPKRLTDFTRVHATPIAFACLMPKRQTYFPSNYYHVIPNHHVFKHYSTRRYVLTFVGQIAFELCLLTIEHLNSLNKFLVLYTLDSSPPYIFSYCQQTAAKSCAQALR